ncbi:MAG: hypothetical protein ACR2QC_12090 [Gammaproteobacteria bacterium]
MYNYPPLCGGGNSCLRRNGTRGGNGTGGGSGGNGGGGAGTAAI